MLRWAMKINRRDFLKGLAGLGAGAVVAFNGASETEAQIESEPETMEILPSPTTSITIPTHPYTITSNSDSTGGYATFDISSAATSVYAMRFGGSTYLPRFNRGALSFSTASSGMMDWGA
jgi:hypothetical protein